MKSEEINLKEVYESIHDYKYALIYMISELKLCKTEKLEEEIAWNECLEARFFSEEKELHIFERNGEKKAVKVSDEKSDETIEKKYSLDNKFKSIGNTICVKEYLDYDEDGQIFVKLTRLEAIE